MKITFNNQALIQNKYQPKHKSIVGFTSNDLNEDIFESKSYKNPSQMYFDNYNDFDSPNKDKKLANKNNEYLKALDDNIKFKLTAKEKQLQERFKNSEEQFIKKLRERFSTSVDELTKIQSGFQMEKPKKRKIFSSELSKYYGFVYHLKMLVEKNHYWRAIQLLCSNDEYDNRFEVRNIMKDCIAKPLSRRYIDDIITRPLTELINPHEEELFVRKYSDIPNYQKEKKIAIDKIINPILNNQSDAPKIIVYSGPKSDLKEFVYSTASATKESVRINNTNTPINFNNFISGSCYSISIIPDAYKYFSNASPYAKQNIEALKKVKECGAIFIMMTTEPKKLQAALGGKKEVLTLSLKQQTPKELTSVLRHFMNETALNIDKRINLGEDIKPIYEKFDYEHYKNILELIIKKRQVGYKDIEFLVEKSLSQYKKDTSKSFSSYVSEQLMNMLEATSYED